MGLLTGDSLRLVATLADTGTTLFDGTLDLELTSFGDQRIAYSISFGDTQDGIQVTSVGADGTLTSLTAVPEAAGTPSTYANAIDVAETQGGKFLVLAGGIPGGGGATSGLMVYEMTESAPYLSLTSLVLHSSDPSYNMEAPTVVESVTIETFSGGRLDVSTYVYVGDLYGGISAFSLSDSGTLTSVQNIDHNPSTSNLLLEMRGLEHYSIGSFDYLAALDETSDAITIYNIFSGGSLSRAGGFGGLGGGREFTTYVMDDTVFFYVYGNFDRSLTVFRWDLTNGTNYSEVQRFEAPAIFSGVKGMNVVESGGRAWLAVPSYAAPYPTVSICSI